MEINQINWDLIDATVQAFENNPRKTPIEVGVYMRGKVGVELNCAGVITKIPNIEQEIEIAITTLDLKPKN